MPLTTNRLYFERFPQIAKFNCCQCVVAGTRSLYSIMCSVCLRRLETCCIRSRTAVPRWLSRSATSPVCTSCSNRDMLVFMDSNSTATSESFSIAEISLCCSAGLLICREVLVTAGFDCVFVFACLVVLLSLRTAFTADITDTLIGIQAVR